MAISNSGSFGLEGRDPVLAMALSVVPGVGQFYNGESRKGLLFLLVSAINCVAILLWFVREALFAFFTSVATVMHVSLNRDLANTLLSIKANSPLGYALLLLLFFFTAFAMQDAFAKAHFKRLRAIYSSSSLAISEAAAGSYLMHLSLLFFVLLFVFFFCKAPQPKPQFTEIEFRAEQDAPIPKKVVDHKSVSQKAAEATGKHNPMEKVATAAKGSRAAKPPTQTPKPPTPAVHEQSQPKAIASPPKPQPTLQPKPSVAPPVPQQMPQPHPQLQAPTPRPMATPNPVPQPNAVKTPEPSKPSMTPPRPILSATPTTINPLPQPTFKTSDSASKVSSNPLPTLTQSNNSLLAALPPAAARHQSSSAASGQPGAPAPIRDTSSASGSSSPSPVPSGKHSSSSSNNSSADSGAPQPKAVEGGHSGKSGSPALAVAPAAVAGDNGAAKEGRGNPQAGARPSDTKTIGVDKEPDFSRFMADLQRRIKQVWFPPKAPASANCVIIFNVHLNGEMSGLRVQRSSGIAAYDHAALKAVENAAPFRPLPEGAKEAVDVQFTFDYNVFQGGGGALRRF